MKIFTILTLALFVGTACTGGGGGGSSSTSDVTDGSRDPADNSGDGTNTGDGSGVTNPDCVEKLGLNKIPGEEVFIGSNDWTDTKNLTDQTIKTNAAATVYVRMSASRCTGFLVSEDVIMTNNHCIGSASEASGVYVRFDWLDSAGGYKQYTCDEFIGTNSGLDFTLVRCKGSPGKTHPQVVLGSYQGKTGYPIYVTQQNCDYYTNSTCTPTQKIAYGSLTGYSSTIVNHSADTLGGSSGSPVFDKESHKVVAIHNAGSTAAQTNYGIQMYKIVDYIKDYFPEVAINSSATRDPAWDVCD